MFYHAAHYQEISLIPQWCCQFENSGFPASTQGSANDYRDFINLISLLMNLGEQIHPAITHKIVLKTRDYVLKKDV